MGPHRKTYLTALLFFLHYTCSSTTPTSFHTSLLAMSLEQDELTHSCAFCQQFVIDHSEENGGLSATRRQMLDRFLLHAGVEGPDVSHPEEYEKVRSKLRTDLANIILFDVAPKDLRSPAAKDCSLAKELDRALKAREDKYAFNPSPSHIPVDGISAMFVAKLVPLPVSCPLSYEGSLVRTANLQISIHNSRPASPSYSWTIPRGYSILAEEGA